MGEVVERDQEKPSVFARLVDELVNELQLRLPAKSLIKFSSVSEQWRARINSQAFVDRHMNLNREIRRPFTTLFAYYRHNKTDITKLIKIYPTAVPSVNEEIIRMEQLMAPSDRAIGAVLHCNGLLAVNFLPKNRLVICNPSTWQAKILPKREPFENHQVKTLGFGCDGQAQNFKCVFLLQQTGTLLFRGLVYSRILDSWQKIDVQIDVPNAYGFWRDGVHSNDYIYWVVPNAEKHQLLGFNLSSNSFSNMLLPNEIQRAEEFPHSKRLLPWKNSIALLFNPRGMTTVYSFEIWVLENSSWSHFATLKLSRSMFPLAFLKPNKLLLQSEDGTGWSYDISNKDFLAVPIEQNGEILKAINFSESLVPLY